MTLKFSGLNLSSLDHEEKAKNLHAENLNLVGQIDELNKKLRNLEEKLKNQSSSGEKGKLSEIEGQFFLKN